MTKPVSRSELRRLGKLGSYRLGLLAPQGIARPAPPRQFRPSFVRPRRSTPVLGWIMLGVAGAAVIGGGAMIGLWYVPLVVGILCGLAARVGELRTRSVFLAVLVMCGAGWGGALAAYAVRGQPVGATARVIAAIAGLPAHAAAAIACTLALSMLLGLAGFWLGRALTPWPAR